MKINITRNSNDNFFPLPNETAKTIAVATCKFQNSQNNPQIRNKASGVYHVIRTLYLSYKCLSINNKR
jgi:hypothetical protein